MLLFLMLLFLPVAYCLSLLNKYMVKNKQASPILGRPPLRLVWLWHETKMCNHECREHRDSLLDFFSIHVHNFIDSISNTYVAQNKA